MSWITVIAFLLILAASSAVAAPVSKAKKVIMSLDIGDDIDDAFALAFALKSPELDVDSVVVSWGPTPKRGKVAAKLLEAAGREDIPVIIGKMGENYDRGQLLWAKDYTPKKPVVTDGAHALVRRVMNSSEKVTIIPTGPLTDIAEMIRLEPRVKEKIDEIVLMGGSIYRDFHFMPQACAETNIVLDTKASQTVFESGIPIVQAPLDVTVMMQPGTENVKLIAESDKPLIKALHELVVAWGHVMPTLFDPVAVAVTYQRDLVKMEHRHVAVTDQGVTVIVPDAEPNTHVCLEIDKPRFMKLFMDRILE